MVLTELRTVGHGTPLEDSLEEYSDYVEAVTGFRPVNVDLEDFAAYLDYEHFFGMLGTPFTTAGNRPQLQLRWGIGRVLHRATPPARALPTCYLRFAEALRPLDVVVTFNYDCILELALAHVGTPFRRFPSRYMRDARARGLVVDIATDSLEVLLVKVHGSIDWTSIDWFEGMIEYLRQIEGDGAADSARERDALFGSSPISSTAPLTEGRRPTGDPFESLVVIRDLDAYYATAGLLYEHPPLILTPSTAKQLYGRPLAEQWRGMTLGAGYLGGLSIIGYSLPPADPYARQILFRLVDGYTSARSKASDQMRPMDVVSLKRTGWARKLLRRSYRFLPREHTRYSYDGFDLGALERLFD